MHQAFAAFCFPQNASLCWPYQMVPTDTSVNGYSQHRYIQGLVPFWRGERSQVLGYLVNTPCDSLYGLSTNLERQLRMDTDSQTRNPAQDNGASERKDGAGAGFKYARTASGGPSHGASNKGFAVLNSSLQELDRRPRKIATEMEKQRTLQRRRLGACDKCRRSKRRVRYLVSIPTSA